MILIVRAAVRLYHGHLHSRRGFIAALFVSCCSRFVYLNQSQAIDRPINQANIIKQASKQASKKTTIYKTGKQAT